MFTPQPEKGGPGPQKQSTATSQMRKEEIVLLKEQARDWAE